MPPGVQGAVNCPLVPPSQQRLQLRQKGGHYFRQFSGQIGEQRLRSPRFRGILSEFNSY